MIPLCNSEFNFPLPDSKLDYCWQKNFEQWPCISSLKQWSCFTWFIYESSFDQNLKQQLLKVFLFLKACPFNMIYPLPFFEEYAFPSSKKSQNILGFKTKARIISWNVIRPHDLGQSHTENPRIEILDPASACFWGSTLSIGFIWFLWDLVPLWIFDAGKLLGWLAAPHKLRLIILFTWTNAKVSN